MSEPDIISDYCKLTQGCALLRHRYVNPGKIMLPIKQYHSWCDHYIIANASRFN
ncbi:protein of unknown function [Sterolibacterium denitrificans]|uniref:Uncharacterized protein n=1 Tax=Sterolibacterium denitrificans TaxID=157592 RepID=A0A7Z7MUH1_9PROT|nr:protein of unknown function [Sterolibacterium denitrificans]